VLASTTLRIHYLAPLTTTKLQFNSADLTVATKAGSRIGVGHLNRVQGVPAALAPAGMSVSCPKEDSTSTHLAIPVGGERNLIASSGCRSARCLRHDSAIPVRFAAA
jgi:hypothetical protein